MQQATANCAWGGEDRSTLYITADMFLCRVKTTTTGASAPSCNATSGSGGGWGWLFNGFPSMGSINRFGGC